jgi:hypothetical protein
MIQVQHQQLLPQQQVDQSTVDQQVVEDLEKDVAIGTSSQSEEDNADETPGPKQSAYGHYNKTESESETIEIRRESSQSPARSYKPTQSFENFSRQPLISSSNMSPAGRYTPIPRYSLGGSLGMYPGQTYAGPVGDYRGSGQTGGQYRVDPRFQVVPSQPRHIGPESAANVNNILPRYAYM